MFSMCLSLFFFFYTIFRAKECSHRWLEMNEGKISEGVGISEN